MEGWPATDYRHATTLKLYQGGSDDKWAVKRVRLHCHDSLPFSSAVVEPLEIDVSTDLTDIECSDYGCTADLQPATTPCDGGFGTEARRSGKTARCKPRKCSADSLEIRCFVVSPPMLPCLWLYGGLFIRRLGSKAKGSASSGRQSSLAQPFKDCFSKGDAGKGMDGAEAFADFFLIPFSAVSGMLPRGRRAVLGSRFPSCGLCGETSKKQCVSGPGALRLHGGPE